jgi:hypothetical protein
MAMNQMKARSLGEMPRVNAYEILVLTRTLSSTMRMMSLWGFS